MPAADDDDEPVDNTNIAEEPDIDITRTVNLRVSKIRVMLNTNIPGMKAAPLTYAMLSHPDLERGKYSGKNYTMPYFTDSVKYPFSVLASKTYADRVDFFFNKTRFNKILRKNIIDYIEEVETEADYVNSNSEDDSEIDEKLKNNADHNIKAMLVLLFPVADEFGNVFASSYDQYILNKPSPELVTVRNIDKMTFLNPTWIPLYNYFKPREYSAPIQEISYLKQGESKYVVSGVVWQNDVVNHPVYNTFLSVYYSRLQEKRQNGRNIRRLLSDRITLFKGLLSKYTEYERIKPAPGVPGGPGVPLGPESRNVFEVMISTLIKNVSEADPAARTDNQKYKMETFDVRNNMKEYNRREAINKVVAYLAVVDDLYKGYSGEPGSTTPADPRKKITSKRALKLDDDRLKMITDSIANAYIELNDYNALPDAGTKLNLKDTSRILTELFNAAISIKTLQLLNEFVNDTIRRLDLNETNVDGSKKPKLELDIIHTIKTNYKLYEKLNEDISTQVKNVVEPARRTSNVALQNFLKEMVKPTVERQRDQNALVDIYNKYIANIKKSIRRDYITKYMYVGICTVSGDSADATPGEEKKDSKSEPAGEMPEIYVYVNVVDKAEYEKNANRGCIMSDDRIANNLRQLLYANTMIDDTLPEVNPYRTFKFLKGSETQRDEVNNTNTPGEPDNKGTENKGTENKGPENKGPEDTPNTKGGRYRKSRKYARRSKKYTRKYRLLITGK